MKRANCTLSFIVSLLLAGQAAGQELPFVHYTVDNDLNPLPSASVSDLMLDSQGFLWFVIHSSGLFRYDGHVSEVYSAADGLPANSVVGMLEDQKGRLWVHTRHGLAVSTKPLDEYAPGERLAFTAELNGIEFSENPASKSGSVAMAADGGIWVADKAGVRRYSYDASGRIQSQILSFGKKLLGQTELISVQQDREVWVVTDKNEVAQFSLNGDLAELSTFVFEKPCLEILSLLQASTGETLLGCRSGSLLKVSENSEGEGIKTQEILTLSSPIRGIDEGTDASLWVSTEGSGVYYSPDGVGGSSHSMISRKNGLIGDTVARVLQDPEGNIWIGQSGGVSKLQQNYKAFQTFTADSQAGERPVLPSAGIRTVRVVDKPVPGSMWVGTNKGLVVRTPDGAVDFLDSADGLKDANVWIQCSDHQGRLWFNASSVIGVVSFTGMDKPKGFAKHRPIEILGEPATLSIRDWAGPRGYSCTSFPLKESRSSELRSEAMCFSGARHVECWSDDGAWTILDRKNGLMAESNIQSIVVDDAGYMLAGTEAQGIFTSTRPMTDLLKRKGYSRANDEEPGFRASWAPAMGAPTGDVEYMLLRKGKLWLGTDQGVLKVDPKTMRLEGSVTVKEGLPDNFSVSLYESPTTGNIWVGTNAGMAEINPENLKVVRVVTRTDGLVDNEVWWLQSLYVGSGGEVYYGTPKGLSIYRPSEHRRNTRLPKPVFRYADLNLLPNGTNELKIGYTALSYSEEQDVRYKYRIRGYDDTWSKPTKEFSQKFMNLPATMTDHHYQFELLASNNDGLWSAEPIRWDFTISPPWWLRWWFWLGSIITLTVCVVMIYRQRVRRLGERARELKEFANALQMAVDNLDEELEERKRVEGQLNEVRMKMTSAEKAAAHAQDRRTLALNELKSAKETLIQAEKLSSLGQMVASISHEIANPVWLVGATAQELNSQIGELESFLGALFDESEEAQLVAENVRNRIEKMRSALENSFTASGRLTDITQALRTQSRFDRAPTSGVVLNEVIRESLIITGGKTKRHQLTQDLGELPLIICFRSHIGQVLTNLFANAADALDERVVAERAEGKIFKGQIRVQSYVTEREGVAGVSVAVSDNGLGVEETLREQIFEAFFTTKASGVGTGLGLSVCATIASDHGGVIRVEADDELGGARFVLWLPVIMVQEDEGDEDF